MRRPAWVGQVLLRCVREHDWEQPPPGVGQLITGRDQRLLLRAAEDHRVVGCVYRSLKDLPQTDSHVLDTLAALHNRALRSQLRARADLVFLRKLLNGLDVPWLLFKGPVMAELAYANRSLRHYLDLDLLVPRPSFPRVLSSLEEAGYRIVVRDWTVALREQWGEVDLLSPSGTSVDLHWDLTYHEHIRSRFRVSTEELFEHTRMVMISGAPFPTFDPPDTVIHLSMHGIRTGGSRLQWLKDIERVVARDEPDWDEVITRASRWGLSLAVGVMLGRARALLGCNVPEEVVRTLVPRTWRAVVVATDRLSPIERSAASRSLATLVARSTSSDVRSSLKTLVRTTVERAAEAVNAPRGGDRPEVERDQADVDPRAAFFDWVATGSSGAVKTHTEHGTGAER
jgi:Uncharacterised nucleotidyltransferase